jgi:hypothetical protein
MTPDELKAGVRAASPEVREEIFIGDFLDLLRGGGESLFSVVRTTQPVW